MLSSSCTYQSSTYVFRDLSMYKKNFEMNVLTEFSIFQNIFKLVRLIFISKRALVRFAFERKVGEKIKMTKILLRTQSQLLKSSRLSTHLEQGIYIFCSKFQMNLSQTTQIIKIESFEWRFCSKIKLQPATYLPTKQTNKQALIS